MRGPEMFKYFLAAAALVVAGVPAAYGLAGNDSFSRELPVRVPEQAQTATPTDAPTAKDDGTADRGRGEVEPGDDHGGDVPRDLRTEAGDDHGATSGHAEPGDDHGGTSGSTSGHTAEPGDDHGGTSGGTSGTSGGTSGGGDGATVEDRSGSGSGSGSDGGSSGSGGSSGGGSDDGSGHG